MTTLDREYDIGLLAQGLGVAGGDIPPVAAILAHCRTKVSGWMSRAAQVKTLADLERIVCENLHVVIEEIWTEDDLRRLIAKYVKLGEFGFANLANEFDDGTFGTLYERLRADGRSRDRYVAFIDCRTAAKASRRVFTRWHEIAHAMTLYQQLQLPLHRTRIKGSPTERMMDLIAGELNFYSPLFQPVLAAELDRNGPWLTFSGVDRIRDQFHRESSFQSTLNACVRGVRYGAAVVEASLEHKKVERQTMDVLQGVLLDLPPVPKTLRLTTVAPNEAARAFGLHPMLRVPAASVIFEAFSSSEDFTAPFSAVENLSNWTHSRTAPLRAREVMVEARKLGGIALGLIQAVDWPKSVPILPARDSL